MAEAVSWFDNLKRRRVPQFAGMYIAATWFVIELGDWVTERFNLPAILTSYVFVAMVVMLPAMFLFAYNHGAPGKDSWTRAEKVLIPVNGVIAVMALWFVSPMINVQAATETIRIEDETGAIQEFEVARQGYHQEVINFFWTNESGDADLDWLEYGLPIMLTYDVNRVSPVITALTPLNSGSLDNKLRRQGFDRLTDVPRGLAVELTRDRNSAALVMGSFAVDGDTKSISVSMYDAQSSSLLGSRTVTAGDWLMAADLATAAVLEFAGVTPADNQSDDPVREHFSDSIDAVQHFSNAMVAIGLDNNYPLGITELNAALEIDAAFAEARTSLSTAHYLTGNVESARESAAAAVKNGYRLSEESRFVVKANRYIFDGDYERGVRVLDIWAQVQPNSTRAQENVAQLARLRGGDEGLDKALAAYDRLLELNPNDFTVYLQKAGLEQQRGDFESAATLLQTYLEFVPDSGDAYRQLANVYQAQGNLDAAQQALEDAAILSDDAVASELGLARIETRRGLHTEAKTRLEALASEELGAQQMMQVLLTKAEVAVTLGEIDTAIQLARQASELAKSFIPPAVRLVGLEGQQPILLAQQGRYKEAVAAMDAIAAQLQPPMINYINFSYTTIHEAADNRDEFRRWAGRNQEVESQLPELFKPFLAMEAAQIDIWDGNNESAIARLDSASEVLGQSFIQVARDSLGPADLSIRVAQLYVEAGATGKAKAELEDILKVFPSSGHAKLTLANALIAEGDADNARLLLEEIKELWAGADENFVLRQRAEEILAQLDWDNKE